MEVERDPSAVAGAFLHLLHIAESALGIVVLPRKLEPPGLEVDNLRRKALETRSRLCRRRFSQPHTRWSKDLVRERF